LRFTLVDRAPKPSGERELCDLLDAAFSDVRERIPLVYSVGITIKTIESSLRRSTETERQRGAQQQQTKRVILVEFNTTDCPPLGLRGEASRELSISQTTKKVAVYEIHRYLGSYDGEITQKLFETEQRFPSNLDNGSLDGEMEVLGAD
jgi:hypothetical protein